MITKNKFFLIFFLFLFFKNPSLALTYENKIIYQIDNEIITSLDLKNEMRYLLALNPKLSELKNSEIIEISKKSIVKEKIKKMEINNNYGSIDLPKKYLEVLLKNIYSKIGISDLNEFKIYIKNQGISYENVLEKIKIEAVWNEIIVSKFSSQVKIDEKKFEEKIKNRKKINFKSYLMSEIVFNIQELKNLDKRFEEIKKTIKEQGFENAALKYSISQTSKIGGKLDWINENSLNENIKNKLSELKVNEFTDPINIPGGFLILKINEIKNETMNLDVKNILKNMIRAARNDQLNQFSNMYFNKIKNNITINEI